MRNTWAAVEKIMDKKSNNFFISLSPTIAYKIKKTNMKSFREYLCDKNEQIFNIKTVSKANFSKIISEIKSKNSSGHDEIS